MAYRSWHRRVQSNNSFSDRAYIPKLPLTRSAVYQLSSRGRARGECASRSKAPTATACFHRDAATTLLRTLYSTFAALNDPDDYLKQIGLGWAPKARPPSAGMVGSAQGYGNAQIHVDWSGPTRYATFMIYPADSRRIHITLGIESVAHLIQLITEAFH